jgi:hypothetical protein
MSEITEASRIILDFEAAVRAHQSDLTRAWEIWDAYFAVAGGQWDKAKREDLRQQSRHPWQFDVLGPKLDTLAGSLAAELPDFDWLPVEGELSQPIEACREKYYSDKELFNYDDILLRVIRDGCIHSGWCQLRESRRYQTTGNVALEVCRPGYIIPDPYWVSDDDRDCECLYKIYYFLPEQIAARYPKQSEAVRRAIKDRKQYGQRYNSNITTISRDEQQRLYKDEVGDQYRVIEKFYTKEIATERLIGMRADFSTGQMNAIPFPVTNDRALLQRFAQSNKISWDDVSVSEYREKRQYIVTVTDLDPDIILENGETREQVNGLSFYHYTCQRFSGHDKGIGESILDTQRVINEKESYLLEYIAKAGGGSEIWNEDLFKGRDARDRFTKNKNKFGHVEFADLDGVRTPRIAVEPANVPSAVFAEIQRMYDQTLPLVSRVSDAMSSISQHEDSGVLFERKYQMNRIANIMYDKFVKQLINNIAEGYYYQFQITYGDVEQEVKRRFGGSITINKKDIVGGAKVIINDASTLPRSKIVVSEAKNSPIYMLRKKMEVVEIIKSIPPNDTLRLQAALKLYFENIQMADDTRAEMQIVNEMEMQKAMLQYAAEMSGLQTQIQNNAAMSEQITASLAQMQAAKQPPQAQEAAVSPEIQPPQAPQAEQAPPLPSASSLPLEAAQGLPVPA